MRHLSVYNYLSSVLFKEDTEFEKGFHRSSVRLLANHSLGVQTSQSVRVM